MTSPDVNLAVLNNELKHINTKLTHLETKIEETERKIDEIQAYAQRWKGAFAVLLAAAGVLGTILGQWSNIVKAFR